MTTSTQPEPTWAFPFWIAHRGAGKLAPENTLAAFKLGAAHGYRAFECDVKLSSDGVLFLLHDANLTRTSNGQGVAGEHAWQHLSQLDAGSWHSRAFAGEPLPTLANVARFCQRNGYLLNIEIKPTPGAEAPTGRAVALACLALWSGRTDWPLLTSFQPEALEAARAALDEAAASPPAGGNAKRRPAGAPAAPQEPALGLLLDAMHPGWLGIALSLRCQAVVFNHALWDASTVTQAKAAGFKALSYTVNDEWAAQRLIDLGTDGVITDRVDLFAPE